MILTSQLFVKWEIILRANNCRFSINNTKYVATLLLQLANSSSWWGSLSFSECNIQSFNLDKIRVSSRKWGQVFSTKKVWRLPPNHYWFCSENVRLPAKKFIVLWMFAYCLCLVHHQCPVLPAPDISDTPQTMTVFDHHQCYNVIERLFRNNHGQEQLLVRKNFLFLASSSVFNTFFSWSITRNELLVKRKEASQI